MPVVPIDQNRVGIANTTDAKLRAPDMSGTGLQAFGQGLQQLGQAGEQFAQAKFEVQQNEENAAAAAGVEKAVQATEAFERDDQNGTTDGWQPRGAGHTDRVVGTFEQAVAPVLDGIKDKRLRQHWEQQVLATRGNITARTESFAQQQRLDGFKHDASDASDLAASRIQRSDDPNDIADAYDNYGSMVHAMAMPDGAKQAALDAASDKFGKAYLLGQIDRHPDQVAAIIKSGKFDHLGAEALHTAQDQADVEIRRREAMARQQQTLADHAVHERIQTHMDQLGKGVQVPEAQLQQDAADAKRLGDTSTVFNITDAVLRNRVNRETQPWSPQQYSTEINSLTALGTKRTPDQDIRLDQLQKIAGQRQQQFRNDPGQWAALNGAPPPAIDWAHPETLAARSQWQNSLMSATGQPVPFLQPQEAKDMAAHLATPAGRAQVANQIGALGGQAAYLTAKQVAPEDHMLARVVLLQPGARQAALAGQAALAAHPNILKDDAGKDTTRTLFETRLGPAGSLWDQGDIGASYDIARALYADYATKNGITGFNEDLWNSSIHRALGGGRDAAGNWYGGVGSWNGTPVLLPQTMRQDQFDRTLSTILAKHKGFDGPAPVYRDGSPIPPAAIQTFTPVQRGDGSYEFHGPGGSVLHTATGGVWRLDVHRLWQKEGR